MDLDEARRAEHAKYVRAYAEMDKYRIGNRRLADTLSDLGTIKARGSFLDVGCGRGEILREARGMGFDPVRGTEIVPDLIDGKTVVRAEVHALPFPDKSFDVVTMLDVIEHLIPGDDELACRELARVARSHILVTANNLPSIVHGEDVHILKRPYEEWHRLFAAWFAPAKVTRLAGPRRMSSEGFRVDFHGV
jgi:ubiquinone/menaquinone biosynthesis C-methylase UbiE